MPVSPTPKTQAGEKKPTRVPGGWLDAKDRRVVAWGALLSLALACGLGLLMLWMKDYVFLPPDPDANTPVIAPDYPRHLVDFSLQDQSGHAVTLQDLKDKIVVVDFIFTQCSVTCPYVNAQMEKIQQATAAMPDVRLVSLTLDPGDDTVPVLAGYAPAYHADPARWLFLTGHDDAVHNLVSTSFLPPDTAAQFAYMPGNFAHVQRIVLVDRAGRIVSYFDGLNQNAATAVLERIKQLEGAR